MSKLAPWPLPNMTPEQFYALDLGLQREAARMAVAWINATFKMADEDARVAIDKAMLTSQKTRRVLLVSNCVN